MFWPTLAKSAMPSEHNSASLSLTKAAKKHFTLKDVITQSFSERRSERELILSEPERERHSKAQRWARARAHPKLLSASAN